ncbi:hypothetical protein [Quisquiliibacterium transsilvanicum]|uniref:Uncharacterized protein n=1 Tax=Quisquiliibacterium transsilvanicum TaxID=1549638 RepID=A0A7W8HHH3_9BURK|nr:hypothetical protein [Quisquiliibacterium transsilvanicum]MBB5271551.1 hypothetical protein [Quisquiliibacterium transsilvanicum]
MNGLSERHRTLGELMTELRARLGFMTQGSAAQGNEATIKSFLQEAHDYVYGELEPPVLRKKATIALEAGAYLYDWHNDAEAEDIDPGNVLSVWVKASDTIRDPLRQGVTEYDRAFESLRGQPEKYDTLNGQIELWPVPDQAYELVIEYIAGKSRFEQAGDRPSVPDRLVFLYALANAKAHYRHPDAQASATSFQNMLAKAKSKQKENRRFFAAGDARPGESQVVRTANGGYTLRS